MKKEIAYYPQPLITDDRVLERFLVVNLVKIDDQYVLASFGPEISRDELESHGTLPRWNRGTRKLVLESDSLDSFQRFMLSMGGGVSVDP